MTYEIVKLDTARRSWATFSVATVRLPDGKLISRDIEDHGAAVSVLPYDPARRVALLVEQFRAPPFLVCGQEQTLEVIAGIVEGEDVGDAARREALEEGGLRLRDLDRVATCWSMPGVSTERMTLYLAAFEAPDRVAAGGGLAHEDENIRVVEMPLAELARLMRAGELVDMKTLALLQALQLRRPDLFD